MLRHVALKDLDLLHRLRARHILDQLGERHPVGRRRQDVRDLHKKSPYTMYSKQHLSSEVGGPLLRIQLTEVGVPTAQGATVSRGVAGRLWFRRSPHAPNFLDLLDLVLLRQAWVVLAALEHGLFKLPLPFSHATPTLVAPADCVLAEIEGGEICDRREPIPLAAVGVRAFAALMGATLDRKPPP